MPKNAVPNCSEVGTLNPIVGIIGLMQANEVIKILTGTGDPIKNQLLIYNSADNSQFKMKMQVENTCDNVGKRGILKIFKKEEYADPSCEIQEEVLLITLRDFKQKLNNENLVVISVIEEDHVKLPMEVSMEIPISEFDVENLEIDTSKDYFIICRKGLLSYTATQLLKEKYPELNVFSLKNGMENY